MAFIAVAAKSVSELLQVILWRPPADSKGPVPWGVNLVILWTQMEVVVGKGVLADTPAVPLAQEFTADFSSPGHIGDVPTKATSQEGLHQSAVVL